MVFSMIYCADMSYIYDMSYMMWDTIYGVCMIYPRHVICFLEILHELIDKLMYDISANVA